MRRSPAFVLHVLLPLVVGGCLYLLFRSTRLLMFSWAGMMGLSALLDSARAAAVPWRMLLPAWMLFSLPTALYYLSVLNYCWLMLAPDRTLAWRWTLLVSALAFGVELLQTVLPLAGTFSWQDLAVYALVFPLSLPFRAYLFSEEALAT